MEWRDSAGRRLAALKLGLDKVPVIRATISVVRRRLAPGDQGAESELKCNAPFERDFDVESEISQEGLDGGEVREKLVKIGAKVVSHGRVSRSNGPRWRCRGNRSGKS